MINWLTKEIIIAVHAEMILCYGGAKGIRDVNLLESALNNPKNSFNYEHSDLLKLASVYCYSISRSHPFVDGNKRTAFMAMMLFLALNEIEFTIDEEIALNMMVDMAAGNITADQTKAILAQFYK